MANIKSYATIQVRFLGYPEGVFPQQNGEFVDHVYRGYHFRPPNYVTEIAYEQAVRAQADFPKMYRLVNESESTMGGAVEALQAQLTAAKAEIEDLKEKLAHKRPPGRPRKDNDE